HRNQSPSEPAPSGLRGDKIRVAAVEYPAARRVRPGPAGGHLPDGVGPVPGRAARVAGGRDGQALRAARAKAVGSVSSAGTVWLGSPAAGTVRLAPQPARIAALLGDPVLAVHVLAVTVAAGDGGPFDVAVRQ